MLDKPHADADDKVAYRDVNRKAVTHFSVIYDFMVDMHGRPMGELSRLNPAWVQPRHGVRDPNAPRLIEFRILTQWPDAGGWHCLGSTARGDDIVALVEYLSGGADRKTCAERLLDRIATVRAA
jgi:hypothetical protein